MLETILTDILVIGAGGAAARAAVEAAGSGVSVHLVDKGKFGQSGTSVPCLQGFASTLNPEDSPEQFVKDWLRSSENICDQNLVWEAIEQSRKAVEDLEYMGMVFIANDDGSRLFYRGAGHSIARGMTAKFHKADGPNTITILRAEAEKRGVQIHEGIMITKLLQKDNGVVGAVGVNQNKRLTIFRAKTVVLASGGANRIYPNTAGGAAKDQFRTTGDSFSLAFKAGTPLIDMEFTQFRESPPGAAKFGGIYINALGEQFMQRYDPKFLEKAPRAKVVQAVYTEMMAGRGPIKWEVGGIPKEEAANVAWVQESAAKKYVDVGIDFQRMLGGTRINEQAETTITGLFAAGESSGGVQGAGRMQGAAFLETQVFGTIAGKNAAALARNIKLEDFKESQIRDEEKRITSIKGTVEPADLIRNVHEIMWKQVGIVRNREGLENAIATFEHMKAESLPKIAGDDIFTALEATNLLLTGELVARAALAREESRGAHFRSDYPKTDDNRWLNHVCLMQQHGETKVSMVPIITRKED